MLLCAILTITAISTDTAYAAEKNVPVKVTFKKKTLTLNVNIEKGGIERIKVSMLKKKWGKPSMNKDEFMAEYAWKKGKSEIKYVDVYEQPRSSIQCGLGDGCFFNTCSVIYLTFKSYYCNI